MSYETEEPLITNVNSKEVYILLYFEFEYRKSRTIKGDTMLKPTYATKCSILHSSILKSSAMIACSTLFYLCCQAWCDSAALEARLCRRAALPRVRRGTAMTYLTIGTLGGIFTSSLLSQRSSSSPSLLDRCFLAQLLFSLSSIGAQKLLSFPLWFPHQSLREKGAKLD